MKAGVLIIFMIQFHMEYGNEFSVEVDDNGVTIKGDYGNSIKIDASDLASDGKIRNYTNRIKP